MYAHSFAVYIAIQKHGAASYSRRFLESASFTCLVLLCIYFRPGVPALGCSLYRYNIYIDIHICMVYKMTNISRVGKKIVLVLTGSVSDPPVFFFPFGSNLWKGLKDVVVPNNVNMELQIGTLVLRLDDATETRMQKRMRPVAPNDV